MLNIIFRIKPKYLFIVLFFPFLKLHGLKCVLHKISPVLNCYIQFEKLIKQTQFHPGYFSPPIKQTVIFGQIQINFII